MKLEDVYSFESASIIDFGLVSNRLNFRSNSGLIFCYKINEVAYDNHYLEVLRRTSENVRNNYRTVTRTLDVIAA